ncbi:MAG TPA: translation initiation factor IF-1 [Chloroflexota bacterium]|nr:translation initiation factor IF-1 [Chloroflexota bacterium]
MTEGTIVEALPQALYRVQLGDGRLLTAHIATGMRMTYVRALPGDRVLLEVSSFDKSRARIVKKLS